MYKQLMSVVLTFVFCLPALAQKDIFMKQKYHTDPIKVMGQTQPAEDEIKSIWISKDKMRSDETDKSIIMRTDLQKMYMIDHTKKQYQEMPMNLGEMMDQAMEEAEEEEGEEIPADNPFMKMAQAMMGQMKVSVTPTDETRKINNWNCKKYIFKLSMGMGTTESVIWATEELKIDPEIYSQFMASMFNTNQQSNDKAVQQMAEEFKKIKGVMVLQESSTQMMGADVKSTVEMIEFKEGKAPAGSFDIPAGYEKVSFMESEE
ncbi:MAG: hypothetical protein JXR46_06990 [Calditrichaceae bacterium]|nr:hypothetical protein [Calditrichaceae bacterium]MBN2708775.1 hypothetical protein [Calditrichaceae bacterium]RQV97694.1 MAG: hypothetical protein EH224_01360 [Calditrichota bacterium]